MRRWNVTSVRLVPSWPHLRALSLCSYSKTLASQVRDVELAVPRDRDVRSFRGSWSGRLKPAVAPAHADSCRVCAPCTSRSWRPKKLGLACDMKLDRVTGIDLGGGRSDARSTASRL